MQETKRQSPTKMLLDVSLNTMNKKHSDKITSYLHSSLTYIVLYNSSTMKFSFFTCSNVSLLSDNQQEKTIRKMKYTNNDGQCSNKSDLIYVYIVI